MAKNSLPVNYVEEKRRWVRLTKCCNNNCIFCLDGDSLDGKILPLEDVLEDLREGIREGASRAVLSGGDPTLHPDFIEITGKARSMGYRWVQAITNGRMFSYGKYLRGAVAAGLDEITFSLHGHTRELFEAQTRAPGSFVQSLKGLSNALSTPGLVVSVDIVVNRMNIEQLEEMLRTFINMGVREFDLLNITPFGNAWKGRASLFFDPELTLPHLHGALSLANRPDVHIWTNRFKPRFLEGHERFIQSPSKFHDEVRGREPLFMGLLSEGGSMPCRGERCSLCMMTQFCAALEDLKSRFDSGGKMNFSVDENTLGYLESVEPERIARMYLDSPSLIREDSIQRLVRRKIPVTLVYRAFPRPEELRQARGAGLEISINRKTAKKILGRGLPESGVTLAFHNSPDLDSELAEGFSMQSFFRDYSPKSAVPVINAPPCISGQKIFLPLGRVPLGIYSPAEGWNLKHFTDYFIQFKYYSQSLRCAPCRLAAECPGLHIYRIKATGFSEIPAPIV